MGLSSLRQPHQSQAGSGHVVPWKLGNTRPGQVRPDSELLRAQIHYYQTSRGPSSMIWNLIDISYFLSSLVSMICCRQLVAVISRVLQTKLYRSVLMA